MTSIRDMARLLDNCGLRGHYAVGRHAARGREHTYLVLYTRAAAEALEQAEDE